SAPTGGVRLRWTAKTVTSSPATSAWHRAGRRADPWPATRWSRTLGRPSMVHGRLTSSGRRSIMAMGLTTGPTATTAGAGAAGDGDGAGSRAYFRTQITRTTAAFASGDPPATFTPLALR